MGPARSLYEIIAELTGESGLVSDLPAALRAGGHQELPDDLVAEAVVSFAGTAPAEVVEHLAPFVTAHGPIPVEGAPTIGIDELSHLLATAPRGLDDSGDLTDPGPDGHGGEPADDLDLPPAEVSDGDAPADSGALDEWDSPFDGEPTVFPAGSGASAGELPVTGAEDPADTAFGHGRAPGAGLPEPARPDSDLEAADQQEEILETAGSVDPAAATDSSHGMPDPGEGLWHTPAVPDEVAEIDDLDAG